MFGTLCNCIFHRRLFTITFLGAKPPRMLFKNKYLVTRYWNIDLPCFATGVREAYRWSGKRMMNGYDS